MGNGGVASGESRPIGRGAHACSLTCVAAEMGLDERVGEVDFGAGVDLPCMVLEVRTQGSRSLRLTSCHYRHRPLFMMRPNADRDWIVFEHDAEGVCQDPSRERLLD